MRGARFRLAEPTDAARVLDVKRAAIHTGASREYDAEQRAAWAPEDDALPVFERAIESEQFTVLLAELAGELAGYGVLNGPEGRIDAAYVHPDFVRSGIATSLVKQLEMRARMRGITELDIVASLNARPFYESLGYRAVDTETRTIDGVDIDFAVMHRRLDES